MSQGKVARRLAWVVPYSLTQTLYATARREPARALQEMGWQVTLVAAGEENQETIRGVAVKTISMPAVYFLRQLLFHLKVIAYLWQTWSQWDVILFHQISAVWLLPLRLARWLKGQKRPLLIMDTRDMPDYVSGNLKLQLRKSTYDLVYWLANRWADGQTAITRRMAHFAHIPSHQLLGIWPSGVDLETFAPAQAGRCWPIASETIHLMYTGSLVEKRNLLSLCQAVAQANQQGMSFTLTLVGSGPYEKILKAYVAQSKGCIQLLPAMPHAQIPQLLAQTHVGVTSLPAPDEEKYQASSPIKLFEYMAAGLPILSTCNPCHTDVVENGSYAFWAQDASQEALLAALYDIWQQRANLPELGRQSVAAAHRWTWQASAQKLSAALELGLARQLNGTADQQSIVNNQQSTINSEWETGRQQRETSK